MQRERERRREKEIRELREFSSKLPRKLQQKLQSSDAGFYEERGDVGGRAGTRRGEARLG